MTMRLYEFLLFLHLCGVALWVGAMAAMHFAVRPSAAELLDPPQRLPFMAVALGRLFNLVVVAIVAILISGAWMIVLLADAERMTPSVHAMLAIGLLMIAIFGHIRFAVYKRLRRAVAAKDWLNGGKQLASIRSLVAVNLALGVITIAVATIGRTFS